MKLLLSPDRPNIRWCKAADGVFAESAGLYKAGFRETVLGEDKTAEKPEAVGYMLFHGGETITKTMSVVTEELIGLAEKSEKYLPEDNTITTRLLKTFTKKFPDVPHYLFCDTGFFSKLPKGASTYAVPYEFTKQGVRKYGSNGLCHDWICDNINRMPGCGSDKKIVSIFVGNRTNVAAVVNGQPLETSAGFTPVEGIPSLNGCGDIDPTIIFKLHSTGLEFGDINRILTSESGFSGLLDRDCSLEDIIGTGSGAEMDGVRDIYYYNVIKHIGYSLSVMGGADALAVSCEDKRIALKFAGTLCRRLKFPEIKINIKGTGLADAVENITGAGSELKVFAAGYNMWQVMDGKINSKNKNRQKEA